MYVYIVYIYMQMHNIYYIIYIYIMQYVINDYWWYSFPEVEMLVTCNILMSYATSVVEDAVGNSKSEGGLTGNWRITHCNHKLQTPQPPNHPSKKGPGNKRGFLKRIVQIRICYHYL